MELQGKDTERVAISDERIIELYWARNEKAIKLTDRKYKKYLLTIARNLLCDPLDCDECLNDTYLDTWESIPPLRPRSLKAFLATIMRRIAINRYHSLSKKSAVPSEMTVALDELEGILSDESSIEEQVEAQELGRVISSFLYSLTDRRRFIFISRYYMAEPIDRIAAELKLSRSMINKELAAIRDLLRKRLESEGYKI